MIVHLVEEGLGGGGGEGRTLFRVCKILSKLLGRGGWEGVVRGKLVICTILLAVICHVCFFKGFKWTGSLSCVELYVACD